MLIVIFVGLAAAGWLVFLAEALTEAVSGVPTAARCWGRASSAAGMAAAGWWGRRAGAVTSWRDQRRWQRRYQAWPYPNQVEAAHTRTETGSVLHARWAGNRANGVDG